MATFTQNVSGLNLVQVVLTANLTDLSFTDAVDGQLLTVEFIQDGTGSRTVTSISNVLGLSQPAQAANSESFQRIIYNGTLGQWQPEPGAGGNAVALGGITTAITTTAQAIPATSGYVTLGGSGVDACTLVAPPADGIVIQVLVITAHAHTITTPANKILGGFDTITFTAAVGNTVTLTSGGGLWAVSGAQGVTLSEV